MRAFAVIVVAVAAVGTAAPAAVASNSVGWKHCDEAKVNVNCLDQGDDGTIYQCLVWYAGIEPENNPACFPIF